MYDKNLLKSELVIKDLNLEKLGKILGLSKSSVSKKLNGISQWTLTELQKLAEVLGEERVVAIFFATKVS